MFFLEIEFPEWHNEIMRHLGFDDKDNFNEQAIENIQICEVSTQPNMAQKV